MSNYINFPARVTSYSFYNDVIPQLHSFFSEKQDRDITVNFDFSNVKLINPLVIPNIICAGMSLKAYYRKPVNLFVPWNPELLAYLEGINFFDIIRKYEIFSLDEEYLGGYVKSKNLKSETFLFREGKEKWEIEFVLSKQKSRIFEMISDQFVYMEAGNAEDRMQQILTCFAEPVENGCIHSRSDTILNLQYVSGNNSVNKIFCSVSDSGVGLYSVLEKSKNIAFNNVGNENIRALLEAIYYRSPYRDYGLWGLCINTLSIGGILRIHSDQFQLILTEKRLEVLEKIKTFYKINAIVGDNIIEQLLDNYSIRKTTKFAGTHIEIEIPTTREV